MLVFEGRAPNLCTSPVAEWHFPRGYSSDGRTEGGCALRMAVTPWTQRVAASNNSEFMFSKHGTRICTRQQVRTGDSVSDRAHSIAGRRDHERSSLLSPSLTSGHGTRKSPPQSRIALTGEERPLVPVAAHAPDPGDGLILPKASVTHAKMSRIRQVSLNLSQNFVPCRSASS